MELNQSCQKEFLKLLGHTLKIKTAASEIREGDQIMTESLGEYLLIGILFSASWCTPCLGFLPHLKEFN